MEDKYFNISILVYGLIFLFLGIAAYMDAGITTGNYLLICLPLGLGLILGILMTHILNKYVMRGN